MSPSLVLGPMLRHVDTTSAAIWVQTAQAGTVAVHIPPLHSGEPERVWQTPTFAVHGFHYALVEVTGLEPGERLPYRVTVEGEQVWPEPGSDMPASDVRTLREDEPLHLAFGSCRTSVPHDARGHLTHGVDSLRTFGWALAEGRQAPTAGDGQPGFFEAPDLLLLLGDQVYADSTSPAMQDFIASRRSLEEEPGTELKDFVEYAHLYSLAWSEPTLRWLFAYLPTVMIFDDHDIRDDWNTSLAWRQKMEATSWWHERIVAGLASYWVYQHLGNMSVSERSQDEVWQELQRRQASSEAEVDLTRTLDAFAARVDQHPDTYRWSYARDFGSARLVVADSRAARLLEPGRRAMLDEKEMQWLDEQLQGDCEHLIIGTSVPFMLPEGLHFIEAWNEAMAEGAWGPRFQRIGEFIRQEVDLEHWAAFNGGFESVARMVTEVADGKRGQAPSSVMFLSGDVHHSYVAEVRRNTGSRVLQLVCSPIRNPLPRVLRLVTAVLSHSVAQPIGAVLAKSAHVPTPSIRWRAVAGPWFDNNLAVLRVDGEDLRAVWLNGRVVGGDHDRPTLSVVSDVELDVPPPGSTRHRAVAHVHPTIRRRRRRIAAGALVGVAALVAARAAAARS